MEENDATWFNFEWDGSIGVVWFNIERIHVGFKFSIVVFDSEILFWIFKMTAWYTPHASVFFSGAIE